MLLFKGHLIILYEDNQTELCKQNTNTIQIKLYHMKKTMYFTSKNKIFVMKHMLS